MMELVRMVNWYLAQTIKSAVVLMDDSTISSTMLTYFILSGRWL
jgi:hypothetical protein